MAAADRRHALHRFGVEAAFKMTRVQRSIRGVGDAIDPGKRGRGRLAPVSETAMMKSTRKRDGPSHSAITAGLDWLDHHANRVIWIVLIIGGALVAIIYTGR